MCIFCTTYKFIILMGERTTKLVAFEKVKQMICSKPILIRVDFSIRFIISTDAYGIALGPVFSHEVGDEE